VAQDEFEPAGAQFLREMGQVLVRHAKDEIAAQLGLGIEKSGRHGDRAMEDQSSP
jgi:hypothetical protein